MILFYLLGENMFTGIPLPPLAMGLVRAQTMSLLQVFSLGYHFPFNALRFKYILPNKPIHRPTVHLNNANFDNP